jgi:hypothetical protein
MANNDLNQKYTIQSYCTRTDVARALGTNLIDPIWKEINEFRKMFQVQLPFFDVTDSKFLLTYIDSVQGKTAQINTLVTNYVTAFNKLRPGSSEEYAFKRDMLKQSLKHIAKHNKMDASEVALTNIIERKSLDFEYILLSRYFETLQAIKNEPLDDINEEFLAKNYARLRGESELTSFYRTDDFESQASKYIVAKEYDNGVPAHLIDDMMAGLFEYITSASVSLVSRISAVFFMFNYIKPFEEFNMEMASILVKRILASTSMNVSSIYVPIEYFLLENSFFDETSKEVKKTHDFTYAFLKGADIIASSFGVVIDRLAIIHATVIDDEVKLGSDEKKREEEFGITKQPEPVYKEVRTETKAQIQARLERNVIAKEENVSEKELKAKAKELLEKNPYLSKKQADFYVHHSTPGRFYTIQQFVKYVGCVYETGRTAMDTLAKYGYYKREQIKNKFVYTPINKE